LKIWFIKLKKQSRQIMDIVKEEFIKIMRRSAGDFTPFHQSKDPVMDGLKILEKYAPNNVIHSVFSKSIYSLDLDVAMQNGITEADVVMLRELNWLLSSEQRFTCFL